MGMYFGGVDTFHRCCNGFPGNLGIGVGEGFERRGVNGERVVLDI